MNLDDFTTRKKSQAAFIAAALFGGLTLFGGWIAFLSIAVSLGAAYFAGMLEERARREVSDE